MYKGSPKLCQETSLEDVLPPFPRVFSLSVATETQENYKIGPEPIIIYGVMGPLINGIAHGFSLGIFHLYIYDVQKKEQKPPKWMVYNGKPY